MIRALALGALLCWPAPLLAQHLSFLIGGIRAEYADTLEGTAGLVAASLEAAGRHARLDATASLARFTSGEIALQLGTESALVAALGPRGLAGGILAGASLNHVEGTTWSGALALGPYVAQSSGPVLASLGLTIGWVRSVDSITFTPATATAGLRYDRGRWHLEGALTGTTTDTIRFLDLGFTSGIRSRALEVRVGAGARVGDLETDPWWRVRAEWTLASWITLEAAAGAYPRDLTGFADGQFVTIGLRLPSANRPTPAASAPVVAQRLDGRARISVALPGARTVAIAGEWNQWEPVPMRPGSGPRWIVELPLGAGVYRYALLVDGERWTVPRGVATTADDFGGQVALLIVPAR